MPSLRAVAAATVEPDRARRHVLARQHLDLPSAAASVVRVADDLIGLHATDPATPYLSLHARLATFRPADLESELYERRSLLRLKCMRGTVFAVSRELAPALFAATRAGMVTENRRWLALERETYDRWAPRVLAALAAEPLSGAELRERLGGDAGLPGVVSMLCDEARIVRDRPTGGRRSNAFRYRRWEDAFPDVDLASVPEQVAVPALVTRYLAAYGPVTLHDIAWWTGLPVRRVRAAVQELGAAVAPVRLPGATEDRLCSAADVAGLTDGPVPGAGEVVLLPELDPLLMGCRDRDLFLDPALRRFVFDRGGNATSVVLDDGRVVGVWDLVDRPTPTVRLLLFDPRNPRRDAVLERCVAAGQFWFDRPVPIIEHGSMGPLTERSGVMRRPLDGAIPVAEGARA